MSLKQKLKKFRDDYVIRQVARLTIPVLDTGDLRRYRITFSGRVQKVGFRLEVAQLAARLQLTGFCQNLESGQVVAELQGPQQRIAFLLSFMESLKRVRIRAKQVEELALLPGETDFRTL